MLNIGAIPSAAFRSIDHPPIQIRRHFPIAGLTPDAAGKYLRPAIMAVLSP